MNGDQQPGSVIVPGATQAQPTPLAPAATVATPLPEPVAPVVTGSVAPAQPAAANMPLPANPAAPANAQAAPVRKAPALGGAAVAAVEYADGKITWTASEYVQHDKSKNWFVLLAIVILGIASIIYLWTRDVVSSIVVIVMGGVFGYYGARKPAVQSYVIDDDSISIGPKHYMFSDLKSFSVVPEGAISSIVFLPMKRLSLPIPIYCAPEQEDEIIEVLTQHLPYEERRQDPVDRLSRRIRF